MSNYLDSCKELLPMEQLAHQIGQNPKRNNSIASTLTATLGIWFSRSRQRRALSGLSDRLLKDVGISPEQALEEANKSFWVK